MQDDKMENKDISKYTYKPITLKDVERICNDYEKAKPQEYNGGFIFSDTMNKAIIEDIKYNIKNIILKDK